MKVGKKDCTYHRLLVKLRGSHRGKIEVAVADGAVSLLVKLLVFNVLSSDAASELHILDHQSNSFGMESTEVTVFEEASDETFRGLLKGSQTLRREPYFRLLLARDLFHQSLEWKSWYDGLDLILELFDFF